MTSTTWTPPPTMPAEQPKSAVERHLAQLRKEAEAAEQEFKDADKAFDDARERRERKLAAFNDKLEVIAKLEGRDDENIRRAWYSQGRIDGRAHAPMRKNFPLHP